MFVELLDCVFVFLQAGSRAVTRTVQLSVAAFLYEDAA